MAPEVVAATCWFDAGQGATTRTFTVRFTGRRIGPTGRPKPGDRFVHEETVENVPPGCGPLAVTATIAGVNPGVWHVDAQVREAPGRDERHARRGQAPAPFVARWSWRRWGPAAGDGSALSSCLEPFVRSPAIVPGSWAVMATIAVVLAVALQVVLLGGTVPPGRALALSLPLLAAGAAGAKLWFVLLHRQTRRRGGWCVQGFVAGVAAATPAVLTMFDAPVGLFLDAAAPGMLYGFAVGRIGCLLTGCCGGRPSGSRWALWSSDRRVGARRLPAQLLESALASIVGTVALAAFFRLGSHHGMLVVAALAAYTLIRQSVLRLRDEPRRSRHGSRLVAAAAASVLLFDVALFAVL